MQVSIAAERGATRRVPLLAWRLATMLLVGAMCVVAMLRLLEAGSHIDDPRVLRFDAGIPVDAPGSAAEPLRVPRQCLRGGGDSTCARLFEVPFEPPGAEGGRLAAYIPQYTGNVQVLLNGTLVADSRHVQSAIHIGQGAPLLVHLAPRL